MFVLYKYCNNAPYYAAIGTKITIFNRLFFFLRRKYPKKCFFCILHILILPLCNIPVLGVYLTIIYIFDMKQFFLYVLATIVGIWVTIMIAVIGGFLMAIMMLVSGMSQSTPKIAKDSVLHLELNGEIEERAQGMSIMDQLYGLETNKLSLNDIIKSIDNAASDSKIEGIFLDCQGGGGGSATMAYIRESLMKFKQSGKWIVSYADQYTQGNYFLATASDSLWLNPVGMVDVHGVGGEIMFYKVLLDKLGVDVQVIKVGTYKSAVEPFILTEPSAANREQVEKYITPIWNYFADNIATGRNVTVADVNQWADSIIMTQDPATFAPRNVVTALKYRHEVLDWMKEATRKGKDDNLNLVSVKDYVATVKENKSSNRVAVLYAVGDIVDDGNEGIVGSKMAPLILELAEDDKVDALVLRINSGGGSAFASEQIWEALQQFKATGKPFYVSMGDVAASGGYYIACGADKIYCQPVTITGSIGIFGLIPSLKGFVTDKLGLGFTTISTNPNSNIGIIDPMTPFQMQAMQNMINRGYETFVGRCAEGRHMAVDSIKAIAEGRVWDGVTALEIGLVDQLGSLTDCINDLAEENGYVDYQIVEYPEPKNDWWMEILESSSSVKERMLKAELGESYQFVKMAKELENINHVQCKMPEVIIK